MITSLLTSRFLWDPSVRRTELRIACWLAASPSQEHTAVQPCTRPLQRCLQTHTTTDIFIQSNHTAYCYWLLTSDCIELKKQFMTAIKSTQYLYFWCILSCLICSQLAICYIADSAANGFSCLKSTPIDHQSSQANFVLSGKVLYISGVKFHMVPRNKPSQWQ